MARSTVKLEEKWAISAYGKSSKVSNNSKQSTLKGKEKFSLTMYQTSKVGQTQKEWEIELGNIRSPDDLNIDYDKILATKRGDLAIIEGKVLRCRAAAPHLSQIPLVLKQLECVDRRTYDLKIYEIDTFKRFRNHPNICTVHSYWSEQASRQYIYKTLVILVEEGVLGDLLRTVVLNPIRPSQKVSLKYLADISKALVAIHGNNVIHGSVKPSSIFLNESNCCLIGELSKVELDSARHTHQLFSHVLMGDAMPHTLVYWAPEVMQLQKYSTKGDMWSLGITLYQLATGEHPFNVSQEDKFRLDVLSANVDWSRLAAYPLVANVCKNLLRVDPDKRWNAPQVLSFCQEVFILDLQRLYRGFRDRMEFKRRCRALIMVQARAKSWVTRMRYRSDLVLRKEKAALMLQSKFRAHKAQKFFGIARRALMKCQANILARQVRRAFLKMRNDSQNCQCYIRRFLALSWFQKLRSQKSELDNQMMNINKMIEIYGSEAKEFRDMFVNQSLTGPFKNYISYEDQQLNTAKQTGYQTSLPKYAKIESDMSKLEFAKEQLENKITQLESQLSSKKQGEEKLEELLGPKYKELEPMTEELKTNLQRIAEDVKRAKALNIKIQHPYEYTKWDKIHEPYNIVENVLSPDSSVYKAANPTIDLTLQNGTYCFIAELIIYPGNPPPGNISVYASNTFGKWTFVGDFVAKDPKEQHFLLEGEQIAQYFRIKCSTNTRGGNLVSIRQILVRGLVRK